MKTILVALFLLPFVVQASAGVALLSAEPRETIRCQAAKTSSSMCSVLNLFGNGQILISPEKYAKYNGYSNLLSKKIQVVQPGTRVIVMEVSK